LRELVPTTNAIVGIDRVCCTGRWHL